MIFVTHYFRFADKGIPDECECGRARDEHPDPSNLDFSAIETRLKATEPPRVRRDSFVLADTWDIGEPGLGGKRNHTLSLTSEDQNVVLLVVAKPRRCVEWLCSPPDHEERSYAAGQILVGKEGDLEAAIAEGKRLAREAWDRWLVEATYLDNDPEPHVLASLREEAPEDLARLLARVRELEKYVDPALKVWTNGPDHIVAASAEEATKIRSETEGLSPWTEQYDEPMVWTALPDDKVVTVGGGDTGSGILRADQWIRARGRGVLCSEEWNP